MFLITNRKGKNIFPTNMQRIISKNLPFDQCNSLPAANSGGIWRRLSRHAFPSPSSFQHRSLHLSPHLSTVSDLSPARFRQRRSRCSPRRRYSRRSPPEAAGGGWWMKTQMKGGGNFWRGTEPLPRAADRRGRSG